MSAEQDGPRLGLTQDEFTDVLVRFGCGSLGQIIGASGDASMKGVDVNGVEQHIALFALTTLGTTAVLVDQGMEPQILSADSTVTSFFFSATKQQLLDLINSAEKAIQHMNDVEEVRAVETPRDITPGGLVLPFTREADSDSDPGAEPDEGEGR
jgi:hypothetical protein